jgi:co-chaperonin GroES (HSP10)
MKIQGKAVLILPDPLPEKTKGGLSVPKTANEQPKEGTVIDCGPICENVTKGDRVIFARKAASIIEHDGKEHCLIAEDKIFYIY